MPYTKIRRRLTRQIRALFVKRGLPLNGSESGGGHFRARFFAPSGPANRRINVAGKKKGRTVNPLIQSKNATTLPVLIALTLACFALPPQARAVCQEGCLTDSNTALGDEALIENTGTFNTALGSSAGTNIKQTDNNIDIGNTGVVGDSNTIRVGNETHTATYIAGVSGATVPGGVGVIVDSSGHLGITTSSARYKENIKPMDK